MERYICIHGHFYQPPRENPWLEEIELQDSAFPFHDWNDRITTECYAPNAVARILNGEGRIMRLVNNYSQISFNFGATLLSWMEAKRPEIYRRILEADKESQRRFNGHGSAIAQVYNHIIMPLANQRDKITQIVWGIADFVSRFGRQPEGMWLAETAVDVETLELLASHEIQFTILSPHQATGVRLLTNPEHDKTEWQEVTGGRIDPARAYLQKLPSGRTITLFFYDGPVSQAVAFERLLAKGETLAARLMTAFSDEREGPQLVHIATDGESYGHHSAHGDMALAYALHHIEEQNLAKLTNYGEFLEKHPPTMEVIATPKTAWSCSHGVDRWKGDCGCNSGRPGWHQKWRGPLRDALDWLRDTLKPLFHEVGTRHLNDPWLARNDYIRCILDRSSKMCEQFLQDHAPRSLTPAQQTIVLKLMEMQRNLLLMYTSCGWFFDELSGIETVQILMYAGRAIQLAEEVFSVNLEAQFLERLTKAPSNVPELLNGRVIYEKYVQPARITWNKIAAHYAISSLFEAYPTTMKLFDYEITREDYRNLETGKVRLVVGRIRMTIDLTQESEVLMFGVLYFGDHNVNCGVCTYTHEADYEAMYQSFSNAFSRLDYPQIIRLMDRELGESTYSLGSLFKDEQRRVLKKVLRANLAETEATYAKIYQQHLPLMRFLGHLNVPLPRAFRTATEFLFNTDLRWAFEDDDPDFDHIRTLLQEAIAWGVKLDHAELGYQFSRMLARTSSRLLENPSHLDTLRSLKAGVDLAVAMPFEVDMWRIQNDYFELIESVVPEYAKRANAQETGGQHWMEAFIALGELLHIRVPIVSST